MAGSKGSGSVFQSLCRGISSKWRALRFDWRSVPDALAASLLLGMVFYRSLLAAVILLPAGAMYAGIRRKERKQKEQRILAGQFRDAIESVITSLKAGDSSENAFRAARKDMAFQYGEDALITKELTLIGNGLDSSVPLEQLLETFAGRWDVEEIRDFSDVFTIVKRSGGNMVEVLSRSSGLLQERIDVEEEIQLLLGNRRMERKIMDLTPFILMIYISLTSPGFFDVLYVGPAGFVFMTACLTGYLAAYMLSEKILDITT